MERKNISWVSWLRVIGMTMIVICHIAAQHPSIYGNMLGQFFNVGVEVFFVISGYWLD